MNRVIKFKLGLKFLKRVFDVHQINYCEDYIGIIYLDDKYNEQVAILGEYIELIEYTGLKDKKGKEIYEGDILRVDDIYNNSNNEILNVIFDLDLASFESISKTDRYSDESLYEIHEFALIVGNIYENPELMEKTE